jgi:cyclic pyranopterin phosphate synthase
MKTDYVRISLLNRCNLNCFYCQPITEQAKSDYSLTDEESLKSSIKLLYEIGIRKVRFTGGEPTLCNSLPEFISFTKSLDSDIHTALTTNGLLLEKKAEEYAKSGLDSLNISLDTLDKSKFIQITGRDKLSRVIAGIESGIKHFRSVKLNTVLIKGVNDNEIESLINFANEHEIDIRFIEFMPSRSSYANNTRYIPGDAVRASLPYNFNQTDDNPSSTARYYTSPEFKIRVGFINSVSHPFCKNCNRIRLRSDGRLYGCLYSAQYLDLFSILKDDKKTVKKKIINLIDKKQYSGCAGAIQSDSDLPSFVNIGG